MPRQTMTESPPYDVVCLTLHAAYLSFGLRYTLIRRSELYRQNLDSSVNSACSQSLNFQFTCFLANANLALRCATNNNLGPVAGIRERRLCSSSRRLMVSVLTGVPQTSDSCIRRLCCCKPFPNCPKPYETVFTGTGCTWCVLFWSSRMSLSLKSVEGF